MPRKPKEVIEKEEILENVEKKKAKNTSTKKVASSTTKTKKDSKVKETSKNSTAKNKEAENKSVVVEKESKVKKATTKSSTKKTSASTTLKKSKPKKASTKTASTGNTKKASTSTAKETKPKKTSTKSTTKKVTTRTKKATATRAKKIVATPIPEYYDLPYHYDQTVVKVLAQTPKTLFVYWDVSNEDKENLEKQFGSNFFDNTVPFLRIKNETHNYTFDVDVDDFANGWYLEVEDSKCDYSIELLRKQRPYTEKVIEYPIYITSSNKIETPNDRILFNTNYNSVSFKNIKTNNTTSKNLANNYSIKNVGKIYNIYDLYKKIYKNEDVGNIFDLTNPSSGNPTSTFK